ncbi:YceD family protein [Fusobacterium perfoetens]|uniref:YceD family protein n=1 Tax=Fusobacterium perfoetens TaxID=852 RepID=UPI000486A89C|nr:DUF177 domain-containing protein [Fusobacterium perfoetens]MCI6151695.1 DUF177 domain-containing protein [Fusobacterium perfoetens]MDY3236549.1 DUF177 domain-containing protein [Fusobacterium perfoetens]
MKIKLSEIDVVINKKFNYTISKLEDVNLVEDIKVEGTIKREKNEYIIFGKYSTKVSTNCVRCLSEIIIDLNDKDFLGVAISKKEYEEYLNNLDKNMAMDDKDYLEIENDEVDIDEVVRQQLILDMPQYPSCYPECEDETYLKKYSGEETDSRWAGLMNIKIKN